MAGDVLEEAPFGANLADDPGNIGPQVPRNMVRISGTSLIDMRNCPRMAANWSASRWKSARAKSALP